MGQRLLGYSVPLQNGERTEGIVIKANGLGVPGVHHYCLGRGVLPVIVRRLFFRYHVGAGQQFGQNDLTVSVSGIQTVGGGQALVVRGQFPVGVHDLELRAGQGLLCDRIVLFNNEAALAGVFDNHRLGIAALPDDYIGRGRVDDVPSIRGFDLVNDIGAGRKIRNADFALGVGREDAVGGQSAGANYAVQTYLAARSSSDSELGPAQRGVSLRIPFLDNQSALGLIFEGQRYGLSFFPSLICTVWDCVSRMNPAGARVSVTTTLLPGFRPVMRISPASSVR